MTTSVYVCTTCTLAGQSAADCDQSGQPRPGHTLYQALRALAANSDITVRPVVCLANCERGCSLAVGAPGKWGYLLGDLNPELAGDLLDYAQAYQRARTGTVMPSRRPASLAKAIVARLPIPGQDETWVDAKTEAHA